MYICYRRRKKAYLNCKLNVEKYKEEEIFTFKTNEISNENRTIIINSLDKIFLINKVENKEKEEIDETNETNESNESNKSNESNETNESNEPNITKNLHNNMFKKKGEKNNTAIIVSTIIVGVVILLFGVTMTYLCLIKKINYNNKKMIHVNQNSTENINNNGNYSHTSKTIDN